jgi:hypothetical protein
MLLVVWYLMDCRCGWYGTRGTAAIQDAEDKKGLTTFKTSGPYTSSGSFVAA